ncbi:MAG: hypothetical protein ACLQVM_00875 [Terriglobia bacterium]
MTLQIALVGNDGILLASDTLRVDTHPDEWAVQTSEHGAKVVLNTEKTTAGAWSGIMPSREFISSVVEIAGNEWGKEHSSLSKAWSELWEAEKQKPETGDCSLLIAHSKKRQVYKVSFLRDKKEITVTLYTESYMRYGVHNGSLGNPSYFFIRRYFPKELIPIKNLVRLAAHYILMAGEINPYGVGGLTIHLSKDGNPFEEIREEKIVQLTAESDNLDSLIAGSLFTPR